MKTKFSDTDLGCLIGDEWGLFGNRIRREKDGLHLVENGEHDSCWFHPEPENPVLPFPFTLEQFRAFCDWHPTFQWEAIESVFTNDDGSLDDAAIGSLNPASGAADLVRAVLATHDAEFQLAWRIHEQLDQCKAQIQRWERLEQNAPTPSEAIAAEGKLAGLRAELAGLLRQLSGTAQEHPQATVSQSQAAPAPAPASAEPVKSAQTEQVSSKKETKEQRQERRYQMCIEAGLKMPDNDYAPLPRGIGDLARREGITRQSFAEDVKAHIRRLSGR
jgi:hypothetical protein